MAALAAALAAATLAATAAFTATALAVAAFAAAPAAPPAPAPLAPHPQPQHRPPAAGASVKQMDSHFVSCWGCVCGGTGIRCLVGGPGSKLSSVCFECRRGPCLPYPPPLAPACRLPACPPAYSLPFLPAGPSPVAPAILSHHSHARDRPRRRPPLPPPVPAPLRPPLPRAAPPLPRLPHLGAALRGPAVAVAGRNTPTRARR